MKSLLVDSFQHISYNHVMIDELERVIDLDCNGLKILQSSAGYKFTTDSILLSSIVKATSKERILEMGSGSGIVSILLSCKTNAKEIIGVEIQKRLFDMSNRSIAINSLQGKVRFVHMDFLKMPEAFPSGFFDVVVANPPYAEKIEKKKITEIDICKTEVFCTLNQLLDVTSAMLKFGGRFYSVIKATRLIDMLTEMRAHKIEPKVLTPVQARFNKRVELFLIYGKHNAKAGLIVEKPLIIYDDEGNYTSEMDAIYFGHSTKEE